MMPWLEIQKLERPEGRAFCFEGETYSYGELAGEVERRAARLAELGVGPGARVGLLGRNSAEWIFCAHAVFWRGATLVPLHWRGAEAELEGQLDRLALDLLISEEPMAGAAQRGVPVLLFDAVKDSPEAVCSPEARDPDEVLTILFTSGTTGQSKGVPLTLRNHEASAIASRARLGAREDDHWLCCLPLCHIGGLAIVLRSAIYGTSFELTRQFEPAHIAGLIKERPVTLASFVPTMVHRLLKEQDEPFDTSLRAVLVGGGPIFARELEEARRQGLPVLPTYGMTEASSQLTTLGPEDASLHLHTAGRPLDGVELRIIAFDGRPAGPGESGAIWARGPMIVAGYLGEGGGVPADAEEETKSFRDGWLCTGDVGSFDEEGYLTIDHRGSDLIVTGGENVDPREVEQVLCESEDVDTALVIGVDDAQWGQIVAAVIVPFVSQGAQEFDSTALLARLEGRCRDRLARFKTPRRWLILDELPTTATGKIHRSALRERLSSGFKTESQGNIMKNPDSSPTSISCAVTDSEFPLVGRHPGQETSVVHIGAVPFGGRGFGIIAGPCAVESTEMLDEAARVVSTLGADVLRGGAFKPRTSPYSFQGLGLEGVSMLREASDKHALPFVTEVLSPQMVEEMEPLVDAFQIGARNMQNFALLEAVGATKRPVLLKRGFGATLSEWLMAAEYIARAGNDAIILCERGIRTFGQETRFTLDLAGAIWAQERSRLPVIIDPSHAIGLPDLIVRIAGATIAAGLDGLMIEVHPDPLNALCDADQALTPAQFEAAVERVRTFAVERPLMGRDPQ